MYSVIVYFLLQKENLDNNKTSNRYLQMLLFRIYFYQPPVLQICIFEPYRLFRLKLYKLKYDFITGHLTLTQIY